jgi:multidrug efflux pump subunit AcrA (membrane-fusion protein)
MKTARPKLMKRRYYQNMSSCISLAALVAAVAIIIIACGQKEEPPPREVVRPVKVMTITSSGDAFTRRLPGTVRAAQRVDLAFQVGGPLIKLPVEEDRNVKKGRLLARIDPRDFEVNLRNAEGQLSKANAALQRAQSEYNRILRIREKDPGAASVSMVDRKEGRLGQSQSGC